MEIQVFNKKENKQNNQKQFRNPTKSAMYLTGTVYAPNQIRLCVIQTVASFSIISIVRYYQQV